MKTLRPTLLLSVCVLCTCTAVAQVDPPTQRPPTTTPQTQANDGWYSMNDSIAKKWALTEDQRRQLRDIDARYDKMRSDPAQTDRTGMLDRRNSEYGRVLNQSQYEQWQAYGRQQTQRGTKPADPPMNKRSAPPQQNQRETPTTPRQ
jgi:hypothetical protein